MKVKTNYVPDECYYFTKGKTYEVKCTNLPDLYYVVCDDGEGCNISLGSTGCAHIDFHCWEVL